MVMGQGFSNYFGAVNAINPMGNPYMMGAQAMMMNPMMGMNSYLNFKDSSDMKSYFNTQIDNSQSGLYASGQGRISQRAYMVAQQLQGELAEGNSTGVRHVLEALKDDKYELAGVELAYDQLSGSRAALRQDIRKNLSGSKFMDQIGLGGVSDFIQNVKASLLKPFGLAPMTEREAIGILNEGAKVNTTVAANALKDATLGFGTDSRTVDYIVQNSNGRMGEINSSYQAMGANLTQDINRGYNPIFQGFGAAERINGQIVNQLA